MIKCKTFTSTILSTIEEDINRFIQLHNVHKLLSTNTTATPPTNEFDTNFTHTTFIFYEDKS